MPEVANQYNIHFLLGLEGVANYYEMIRQDMKLGI